MSLLKGLFSRGSKEPPLPPQRHPELGLLNWSDDADGWIGARTYMETQITLYVGGGSAHRYPTNELSGLLIEPARQIQERDIAARAALLAAKLARPAPVDVVLSAIETYQQYLSDHAYDIVYESASAPDILWRVNFIGARVESCGCDD